MYLCAIILIITLMSTQMNQQIADYFKTQPVLKAWLFGSFARRMKAKDYAIEDIAEITGLTAEEIEGL